MVDFLGALEETGAEVTGAEDVEEATGAPDTHEHCVTPPTQHLHPCLYPVQHSQFRHSGNQNSAAFLVSLPLIEGIAPWGK